MSWKCIWYSCWSTVAFQNFASIECQHKGSICEILICGQGIFCIFQISCLLKNFDLAHINKVWKILQLYLLVLTCLACIKTKMNNAKDWQLKNPTQITNFWPIDLLRVASMTMKMAALKFYLFIFISENVLTSLVDK